MTDDLISRKAAISAVYESSVGKQMLWGHKDLIRTLKNLPSAQLEQRWIPASERLPIPNSVYEDVFVYYLVQNEYGDMMVATFVQFPGGARVWRQMYQDGAIMEDIVAWMPLPECYKGES